MARKSQMAKHDHAFSKESMKRREKAKYAWLICNST